MKNTFAVTIILLTCLLSFGQTSKSDREIIDSLEYRLMRQDVRFAALSFASVGEMIRIKETDDNDTWGIEYRVEIYGSDIYNSLFVSRIEFIGEGARRIGKQIKVDIETLLDIGSETTSGLTFDSWITPREFKVRVYNAEYYLVIDDSMTVRIKEE